MSEEKEIEESLQICKEIEKFHVKDDLNERLEFDTPSPQIDKDTVSKIDQILEGKEESPVVPESEVEIKKEVATDAEEKEKVEEKKEQILQLEAVYDDMPEKKKSARNTGRDDDTQEEYNERHPFLRTVLNMSICMVAALLISLFLTNYVAHHTSVEGNSMEPTLFNSDQLIVENISYILHDPERFDVIVFPYTQDVSYIKRIIGLPGERVRILNGNIYINGEILKENYGKERIKEPGIAVNEMTLGEDEYFVLGDNRNASIDSRKEEVGLVHRSIIKGKAWLRIYPFEEFGLVDESNETE